MPISFECGSCKASYEVGDDLAGKMVLCRECHRREKVPDPNAPLISHICPSCRQKAEYPVAMAGRWVRCPACTMLARIAAASPALPTRRKTLLALSVLLVVGITGTGIFLHSSQREPATRPGSSPQRQRRGQEPGKEGQAPRRRRKGQGRNKGPLT
jgi:hypothetical protein